VREIAAAKLCVLDVVVAEGGEIKGGLGKSGKLESIQLTYQHIVTFSKAVVEQGDYSSLIFKVAKYNTHCKSGGSNSTRKQTLYRT